MEAISVQLNGMEINKQENV